MASQPQKSSASARAKKPGLSDGHGGAGLVLTIENFGPIKKAEMRLRPLTVLFGPNGTGKTFASKVLHSAVGAMISNPGGELFRRHAGRIRSCARLLEREMPRNVVYARRFSAGSVAHAGKAEMRAANFFSELDDRLDSIGAGASALSSVLWEGGNNPQAAALQEQCLDLRDFYRKNRATLIRVADTVSARSYFLAARRRREAAGAQVSSSEKHISEEVARTAAIKRLADDLRESISALAKIRWNDGGMVVREGSSSAFYNKIAANFQVHQQDVLGGGETRAARINIGDVNFTLSPEAGKVEFSQNNIRLANMWSRTLFCDSPVYWKLQGALESMRFARLPARQRELDGVPQYFYDIATLLRKGLPPSDVSDIHANLKEIIGGEIVLNEAGLLRFKEKGGHGEYSMHATAAGIVNLGVLSLLVKNGIVDENTLVFIDEPESNLHPRWQTIMAGTLARLVDAGVHIVIATHSDWMLSTIANIVRRGELGERGGEAALEKAQVGVWLFDRGHKGAGVTTRELTFGDSGYIPDNLRDFSDDLHNETAELLDAMDEKQKLSEEKE